MHLSSLRSSLLCRSAAGLRLAWCWQPDSACLVPSLSGHSGHAVFSSIIHPVECSRLSCGTHMRFLATFTGSWLEDIYSPRVRDYFATENRRVVTFLEQHKDLYTTLRGRLQQWQTDKLPPPERVGQFEYFLHQDEDGDTPLQQRNLLDGAERYLLGDLSSFAKTTASVDGSKLACIDINPDPDEQFEVDDSESGPGGLLRIIDLQQEEQIAAVPGVHNAQWPQDSDVVLYTVADQQGRPNKVYVCDVTAPHSSRKQVLHEPDSSRFVDVTLTKDRRWLLLHSHSKICSEVHLLDAADPLHSQPICVAPRQIGLEYFVEHWNECLVLLSNYQSATGNMNVLVSHVRELGEVQRQLPWHMLVCGDDQGIVLEDLDVMQTRLMLYGRGMDTRPRLGIVDLSTELLQRCCNSSAPKPQAAVHWQELPSWVLQLAAVGNHEADAPYVTLALSSPIHPTTWWDFWLEQRMWSPAPIDSTQRKQEPDLLPFPTEPDTFDGQQYTIHTLEATSLDNTAIPITLVQPESQQTPLACLHVYGAYGENHDMAPRMVTMLLLSMGWAVGWAHVRGGGERGRAWHKAGRGVEKVRGLEDMDAAVDLLLQQGYRVALRTASAGGVLAGAYCNRHPSKLLCLVAEAPFLALHDVMQRPELLLTVHEYPEWGDPNDAQQEKLMLALCPLTGLEKATGDAYPPVLLTTALDDERVPCWATAKWFDALQQVPHAEPSLLYCHASGGHLAHEEDGGHTAVLEAVYLQSVAV